MRAPLPCSFASVALFTRYTSAAAAAAHTATTSRIVMVP